MDQAKACQHSIFFLHTISVEVDNDTDVLHVFLTDILHVSRITRNAIVYVLRASDGLYHARIPIIRA